MAALVGAGFDVLEFAGVGDRGGRSYDHGGGGGGVDGEG